MILKTTDRDGSTRVEQVSRFQRERILREIVQPSEQKSTQPVALNLRSAIRRGRGDEAKVRSHVLRYLEILFDMGERAGMSPKQVYQAIEDREAL